MDKERKKINNIFRVLYIIVFIIILFIVGYSLIKDIKSMTAFFWGGILCLILLRYLQFYIYKKGDVVFVDIEEIDCEEESVVNNIISKFNLSNKKDIISDEKITISTYANNLTSTGLMYVKCDMVDSNKMLTIKNNIDKFNLEKAGFTIYLLLEVERYTHEAEVMLKQFTIYTDKFRFIDFNLKGADTNVLVLALSKKDKKFRMGGVSYKYNDHNFIKMKKNVRRIVKK